MKEMNYYCQSAPRGSAHRTADHHEFLKWKNRMAEYNGGRLPEGIVAPEEKNSYVTL